jgi:hypothetical protein
VTDDDIEMVLEKHGKNDPATFDAASVAIDAETDRIEGAVLAYTDFDDQVASALDEIENVLIEAKVLTGPKQYDPPTGGEFDGDEEEGE